MSEALSPAWLHLSESEIVIRTERCTVEDLKVFLTKLCPAATFMKKDAVLAVFSKTCASYLKRLASLCYTSLFSLAYSLQLHATQDSSRVQLISKLVDNAFGSMVSRCLRSTPPRASRNCLPHAYPLFQIPDNIIRDHLSKLPVLLMRNVLKLAHPLHHVKSVYYPHKIVSELMSYLLTRRSEVASSSLSQLTDDHDSLCPHLPIPDTASDLIFHILVEEFGHDIVSGLLVPPSPPSPTCWPETISEEVKLACLHRYWLNSIYVPPQPCCVCDRAVYGNAISSFDCATPAFHSLPWHVLRNKDDFLSTQFTFEYGIPCIQGCVLSPAGIRTTECGVFADICSDCIGPFSKGTLPKFALANGLFRGSLPDEFKDLTWVEEMVCALCKPTALIARLYGSPDPRNPRYLRGNTCAHEMNVSSTALVLPRTPADVNGNISVVFIGTSPFKSAGLRSMFFIRKQKVWAFLCWLKVHNRLYSNVTLAPEILDLYPDAGILPGVEERVITSTIEPADIFDDETAGYTDHPSDSLKGQSVTDDDAPFVLLDKLGVVDPDGACIPGRILNASAVRNLIPASRDMPDLLISNSSAPVSEYNNPSLFPSMYPTLFPYGIGGFDDRTRLKSVTFLPRANALLDCPDRSVRYHWSFLFTAINIYQRHQAHLHTHLTVQRSDFESLAQKISSVSAQSLLKLSECIRDEGSAGDLTPLEKNALTLLREVNTISNKIPGSQGSMLKMRSSVFGQAAAFNLHCLYFTMNPAGQHAPLFQVMYGDSTVDLTSRFPHLVPGPERARRLAHDPVAAADYFDFCFTRIFEDLFAWDFLSHRSKPEGGILGHLTCFAGTIEVTGRGALHAHFVMNLRGSLNPTDLHKLLRDNVNYQTQYFSFFEDIIQHHLPLVSLDSDREDITDPRCERPPRPPDPLLKGSNPILYDEQLKVFYQEMSDEEIKRCGERMQRHQCQKVCHKYGNDNKCRFKFPHELVEKSWYDEVNNAVVFIVRDSTINFHNRYIMVFCRHNHDLKCILSGRAARAAIIYITDYITKMDMRTHQVLSLLSRAVLETETSPDGAETAQQNAKHVLHKCLTQLSRKREIHGQIAARFLRGLGDVILSHPSAPMMSGFLMSYVMRTYNVPIAFDYTSDDEDDNSDEPPRAPVVEPEQLSISIDNQGRVFHVDQVMDYVHRDANLRDICFYMFSHAFRKRPKSSDSIDDSRRGTKPRFCLLQSHPQHLTHELRLEGSISPDPSTWSSIPRMIGSSAPRISDTPRYYWFVLAHFKPFSVSVPLVQLNNHVNIDTFFQSYTLSDIAKRVTANWEELCNCEDEREAERLRKDDRAARESRLKGMASLFGLNETEDLPVVQKKSLYSMNEELEIADNLNRLRLAGYFTYPDNMPNNSSTIDPIPQAITSTIDNNFTSLSKTWLSELRQATQAIASRRRNSSDVLTQSQVIPIRETSQFHASFLPPSSDTAPPVRETVSNTMHNAPHSLSSPAEVIEDIGKRNNLNEEQWIAYRLIANAFIQKRASEQDPTAPGATPLRLFLTGPGGTGKTHVVKTVKQVMAHYGCEDRIRFLAPTGTAATLIEGRTIHSGLSIVVKRRNDISQSKSSTFADLPILELSVNNKLAVRNEWKDVYLLFLDEMSMVGLYFLAQIDRALRYGKENFDDYFGGLIVILSGDLYQFPPILDRPVYSEIQSLAPVTDRELMVRLGKLAWNSVTDVVELHRQHRMVDDPEYGLAVNRLRTAQCTPADVDLFNSRVMRGQHNRQGVDLSLTDLSSSVAIVKTNNLRKAINFEKAKAITDRYSHLTLLQCEAFDEVGKSGKALSSESERDIALRSQYKKKGGKTVPLGLLHIYIGMPVVLKEKNISTELRITNGACGYIYHYLLQNNTGLRNILHTVFVYFPDSPVQLSHLPRGVVPITPIITPFSHAVQNEDGSFTPIAMRRHQVPIEGRFAATAHFAQGKTMGHITAALGAGGPHAYVCASRPTSRLGLVLTEPTSLYQLNTPRPHSLLTESERLSIIHHNTLVKLGYLKESLKPLQPCYSHATAHITWKTKNDKSVEGVELVNEIDSHDTVTTPTKKRRLNKDKKSSSKRPKQDLDSVSVPIPTISLPGVQWTLDYSCAYDAFIMTLFSAMLIAPASWLDSFSALNNFTSKLTAFLQPLRQEPNTNAFNVTRDYLRDMLYHFDSQAFPRRGQIVIAVTRIIETMMNSTNISGEMLIAPSCEACNLLSHLDHSSVSFTPTLLHPSQSNAALTDPCLLSSWFANMALTSEFAISTYMLHSAECSGSLLVNLSLPTPPPLLYFEIQALNHLPLLADIKLSFPSPTGSASYQLCSIIYVGGDHFVTALFFQDTVWLQDGRQKGGQCVPLQGYSISNLTHVVPSDLISDRMPHVFCYVRIH